MRPAAAPGVTVSAKVAVCPATLAVAVRTVLAGPAMARARVPTRPLVSVTPYGAISSPGPVKTTRVPRTGMPFASSTWATRLLA